MEEPKMKRFVRVPSPALVVAVIALFVSLGGVSYGLATGVIDSREIQDNTIRSRDVRNRGLTGNDMAIDRVGGGAIKESTLGKVKTATRADVATSADTFGGMTARRIDAFTLPNGQSRGVLTEGPFNVIARCRTEGPDQIAELVVQTNANDTAMDGAEKDTDFDVGETRQLVAASAATGTPAFDQEGSGAAIAADGTELLGQELYAGVGVLGQPGQCRFGGVLYAG
jgi:hypothetical protein